MKSAEILDLHASGQIENQLLGNCLEPMKSAEMLDLFASGQLEKQLLGNCPEPMKSTFPGGVVSTWVAPGYPGKTIKFQTCLQDTKKSEKVSPGSVKDIKI